MILSMSNQAMTFLFTIMIGIFLGFIYDIFRILRKTFKHTDLLTNIEDVIYWLFVSFIMFYFMLNKNYGEIRFFSIVGAFIGMILYFLTLSPPIIKVSMEVVHFITLVFSATIKILSYPVKLLLKIISIPVKLAKKLLIKFIKPVKKTLKKSEKYVTMKSKGIKKDLRIIFKKV